MVHGHQVPRELAVGRLVGLVEDQVDEVEPRQQRRRQLDVVDDAQPRVVPAAHLPTTGRAGYQREQAGHNRLLPAQVRA